VGSPTCTKLGAVTPHYSSTTLCTGTDGVLLDSNVGSSSRALAVAGESRDGEGPEGTGVWRPGRGETILFNFLFAYAL
jgi:hypothetical protein